MKKELLQYGQWDCMLKCLFYDSANKREDLIISITITGKWRGDNGIYYYGRDCVGFDYPELLPKGLKDRLNRKAKAMLRRCIKELRL